MTPPTYDSVKSFVNQFIAEAWPGSDVDVKIRAYRALEEMLELNQTLEISEEKAHELVTYVFSRPLGEIRQEAGGVAFTTIALFSALGIDFINSGHDAVSEAYSRIDQIKAKSKTKPKAY